MQDDALSGNDPATPKDGLKTVTDARQARISQLLSQQGRSDEVPTPEPEAEEEVEESAETEAESEAEADTEESEESEETTEQEEESKGEEETEEEKDKSDVLSQIDWDELDEETKIAIAQEIGSGAGKRIGQLTSQIKDLEAQLEAKDKTISEGLGDIARPDNSFANITDESELQKQEVGLDQQIEFFEDWIAGDEEYFTDPQTQKEYTRKDISAFLRTWRNQRRDIPKQREYLTKLSKAQKKAKEFSDKVNSEFDWIHDDASPSRAKYDELISDADVAVLEKVAPMVAAKFKYLAAHAASSMAQPKKKITLKKKGAKATGIKDSGAQTASPRARVNKKLEELKRKARAGDIRAARELRLTKIQSRFK